MKLSHNFHPQPKPPKPLGFSPRSYDQSPEQQNPQLHLPLQVQPDRRQHTQPEVYSSRSTSAKVCPYQNTLVYSQVNDRISQFSIGANQNRGNDVCVNIGTKKYDDSGLYKRDYLPTKETDNLGDMFAKMKMQVLDQVTAVIKEHKTQTANSLKQAIFKIDEGIKRQCIIQFSRQFLPMSYLDDSQKQFQQLQNRLRTLQYNTTLKTDKFDKTTSLLEQQQRYAYKQMQKLKQSLKNLQIKLESNETAIRKNEDKSTNNYEEINNKIKQMQNVEGQMMNQIMKIKVDIKNFGYFQGNILNRVKELELGKLRDVAEVVDGGQMGKSEFRKQLLLQIPTRKGFQKRSSIQTEKSPEGILPSKSMSLTFSLDSLGDLASPKLQSPLISSIKSLKHIKSTKYILDTDNNLMDDSGNYILDDTGQQVKLSEEQLIMLKDSNLVKYMEF